MIQDFLRTIELFEDLTDDQMAHVLMVGMVKRYRAESVILTEGTASGRIHVIHQGSARLSKHVPGAGEEALTILGPGEIFGEAEFFDDQAPSANVIAHTDCDVLAIPHSEVRTLMQSRPGPREPPPDGESVRHLPRFLRPRKRPFPDEA